MVVLDGNSRLDGNNRLDGNSALDGKSSLDGDSSLGGNLGVPSGLIGYRGLAMKMVPIAVADRTRASIPTAVTVRPGTRISPGCMI